MLAPLVANNSDQTPRSESLHGTGDEGGQFVFYNGNRFDAPTMKREGSRGNDEITRVTDEQISEERSDDEHNAASDDTS